MSLTLYSQPSSPANAARPVEYVFTSTTINIQYVICQAIVDGTALPARVVYLDKNDQYVFDASGYLTNALWQKVKDAGMNLPALPSDNFSNVADLTMRIEVKAYEVFGASQPFTDHYTAGTPDAVSNTITALFAAFEEHDDENLSSFMAGSSTARFLTNAPITKKISLNDSETLYIYTPDGTKISGVRIDLLNTSAHSISQLEIPITANNENIMALPIGPADINLYHPGYIANCYQYSLYTFDSNGLPSSETRYFTLDYQRHPIIKRLHWVNPYHGLDSYTFTGHYEKKMQWQRTGYRQLLPSDHLPSDNSHQTLNIDTEVIISLSSAFESQQTVNWLSELSASQSVFLEENGKYIPMTAASNKGVLEDARVIMPVFNCDLNQLKSF